MVAPPRPAVRAHACRVVKYSLMEEYSNALDSGLEWMESLFR